MLSACCAPSDRRKRSADSYDASGVQTLVANIKSQIKRIKTNEKRRLRNKDVSSSLKTAVRRFRTAIDSGDTAAADTALKTASRQLDKAATKGVIHRNQAANRKSAMASQLARSTKSS
jgi:small subunit ribosomal protein S20